MRYPRMSTHNRPRLTISAGRETRRTWAVNETGPGLRPPSTTLPATTDNPGSRGNELWTTRARAHKTLKDNEQPAGGTRRSALRTTSVRYPRMSTHNRPPLTISAARKTRRTSALNRTGPGLRPPRTTLPATTDNPGPRGGELWTTPRTANETARPAASGPLEPRYAMGTTFPASPPRSVDNPATCGQPPRGGRVLSVVTPTLETGGRRPPRLCL